jgi:hypothetical protein
VDFYRKEILTGQLKRKKGAPETNSYFPEAPSFKVAYSEAKANSELSLEWNAQRFGEPGGSKEVDWPTKVRLAGNVLKLVAEVAGVKDIERLEEEPKLHALSEVEKLRYANV